ncbi:HNH endonuclease [Salmonella enterica]|nr:HNH endonuclease [Salmonella enterica]
MLSMDPRKLPGKVTGKGQGTGENWLNDADKGTGVPIPSRIADKLRGREFANFDAFRKALWTEVGKDPELLKQFGEDDIELLKLGRAPTVRFKDSVGKRVKYEIHHRDEVAKGGDVYNVDNLNVVTPKRHIEIHRGK